jgi:hypothetical protein
MADIPKKNTTVEGARENFISDLMEIFRAGIMWKDMMKGLIGSNDATSRYFSNGKWHTIVVTADPFRIVIEAEESDGGLSKAGGTLH